jgi:protein O-GlcNAc transferase
VLKGSSRVDEETQRRHVERIAAHRVDPARISVLPHAASAADHLALYGRLDLALDTFPYCGTTTTCEALWMGVPVVTLAGDRHAARVGASLLAQAGLGELVARSPAEYVAIVAEWARRPVALAALRAGMRARLAASPLLDAGALARAMAAAFRAMWRDWTARG